MAKGLVIPLTANISEFIRGMKLSADAVEDIGKEFDDVERDAENAADEMEADFKAAFNRLETAADNADLNLDVTEGIESATNPGKTAAGVLAGEVVDEFVENWSEAVSSGDYAGAIEDTLANLGSIGGAVAGPQGALLGGVLALGLTTAFQNFMKTSQAIQNAISDIFEQVTSDTEVSGQDAAKAFRQGFLDEAGIDQGIMEALGIDDLTEAWQEVARLSKETGLSGEVVVGGLLGQKQALVEIRGALQQNNIELDESKKTFQTVSGVRNVQLTTETGLTSQLEAQNRELSGLLSTTENQVTANGEAYELWQFSRDATDSILSNVKETKKNVKETPDIKVKTEVNRKAYDALKDDITTPKTSKVTVNVNAVGINAKVQRLMNEGII